MNPITSVTGVRALHRLLREQTADLRTLHLPGFHAWLDRHRARWQHDPVFVQRTRIRALRQTHPQLRVLEEAHRHAVAADAATPQSCRLGRLEQELIDTAKAIVGLTGALQQAQRARRPGLRQKLTAFQRRQRALQEEQLNLIQSSPQRQALLRLAAELQQVRSGIGLEREETHLSGLLTQQGRHSGHTGASFETLALAVTQHYLLPTLLRTGGTEAAAERLRLLQRVKLGAARIEFDQLVIRQPRRSSQPVAVLAAVEVKRNLNDLAHGFWLRQENLAWLTGERDLYDPDLYRTKHFRAGHFDSPAAHTQDGDTFLFAPGSFRRFRRDADTGRFLDRLYLITRAGPLWGLSTMALARIAFRVATDEHWEPDNEAYLRGLLRWCQALAGPFEAPDVLRLYTASPKRGRQIVLIGQ